MQSSTSSASTAVAPHGGGQKGSNSKASLGLPSPTASETSDYQRSTPSPRNAAEEGGERARNKTVCHLFAFAPN